MLIQTFLQMDLLQVTGLTPGRAAALLPGILGLISVILGSMALTRTAGTTGPGRLRATISLVLAMTAIVLSVIHLSRATGGYGTGSGWLGAIVAFVMGLIGAILGGLAIARSRRIAARRNTPTTTGVKK